MGAEGKRVRVEREAVKLLLQFGDLLEDIRNEVAGSAVEHYYHNVLSVCGKRDARKLADAS